VLGKHQGIRSTIYPVKNFTCAYSVSGDDINAGSPLSNSATFLMTSAKESFEPRLCSLSMVMMLIASLAVFKTSSYQGAYCFVGWNSLYLKSHVECNFD
jgi:hypothetical protein